MYTEAEVKSITKNLAKYGITGEEEVKAVMDYIHQSVCIAIRIVRGMNKNDLRNP